MALTRCPKCKGRVVSKAVVAAPEAGHEALAVFSEDGCENCGWQPTRSAPAMLNSVPRAARAHKSASPRFLNLNLVVYCHTRPVTVVPMDGVEPVKVEVSLIWHERRGAKRGLWHLQPFGIPAEYQSIRGLRRAVLFAVFGALRDRDIDIDQVKCWSQVFSLTGPGGSLQARYAAWLDGGQAALYRERD